MFLPQSSSKVKLGISCFRLMDLSDLLEAKSKELQDLQVKRLQALENEIK